MKQGLLIALEGIDGSGTTTQAPRVESYLKEKGYRVWRTAEPSQGPIGRFIRKALLDSEVVSDETLALLFAADRLDHIEREINPAHARGEVVLSDRYLLSSLAYQSSYLPLPWVAEINVRARRPDASILLRVTPEVALERRNARGGADERFDALERQRRIAEAYERVFALPDVGATFIVDANADVDTVTRDLHGIIDQILARSGTDMSSAE